ncbi:hypothetical protein ANN_21710 [Periplaneta americana]|uniref:Tc1-like transposase DDE domain-containing protein n=1 Tax=Periplaneta americana TaxID=6978 RepID=A0ABQ8S6P2_PERAM|nr:hypothetical protein ANN_21710 [Periplaneta americana]
MAGLCEGGNEPSGSLKAICKNIIDDLQHLMTFYYLSSAATRIGLTSRMLEVDCTPRTRSDDKDILIRCIICVRRTIQGVSKIRGIISVIAFTTLKFTGTIPHVLEDTPLINRQHIHFLHDGAPAHFSRTARRYLDRRFPDRWIGGGGPIAWPPRSPDLNPLDFYLWGHLKSLVYSSPVPDLDSLRNRIVACTEDIRNTPGVWDHVRRSMRHRCEVCIQAGGRHFEHLL